MRKKEVQRYFGIEYKTNCEPYSPLIHFFILDAI